MTGDLNHRTAGEPPTANEGATGVGGQELERKRPKPKVVKLGEKAAKSAACDLHLFAC